MGFASESFFHNHRSSDNTAAADSASISEGRFQPLELLFAGRLLAQGKMANGSLNDTSIPYLPYIGINFCKDDATSNNDAAVASAVALTDISPALKNGAKSRLEEIFPLLRWLSDPPDGAKERIMSRFAEEDEANEEYEWALDPNDAPIAGPTVRVIDAPKDCEYGPDGHIVSGTDTYNDGSTRYVRYYPPVEIDGVFYSRPQEQFITHPDGRSEYRYYSPSGEIDLLQISGQDDSVSTFNRRPDGKYNGLINSPGGIVTEGIFNSDFTPIETVSRSPDGSSRSMTYGENFVKAVLRETNGWVHTTTFDLNGFLLEDVIEQANGNRRVSTFLPDGAYLTRNYSPTGDLVGSYAIPPEFRGDSGLQLSDGGIEIRVPSPTGTSARSFTLDGRGRMVSETSRFPNGRVRETITYDHVARTRSITRFDARGFQSQSIVGQSFTPPTYAVPAPH
ncbi:MAG TPA: hypothetical protein PKZ32_09530 [Candidatus Melainabacteria bacterium]|nr:hypothetical protein [Candidatus Melainabacteria bacterium]